MLNGPYNNYYRQSPQSYCMYAAMLSQYSRILNYSFRRPGDMDLPDIEDNNVASPHSECIMPIQSRASGDAGKTAEAIYDNLTTFHYELSAASVDSRLFIYLVESMVSFFNENSGSYKGSTGERASTALRDLREQKPWVLEILQRYNVSPAALDRILQGAALTYFQDYAH
ncbi:MAG: hypothetical protein Q8930_08035 [Bacillota bacterium]|nr:hypothetical protein [Bacillota bacterium]